jgi:misacylated tRNA(Ala) deacylase
LLTVERSAVVGPIFLVFITYSFSSCPIPTPSLDRLLLPPDFTSFLAHDLSHISPLHTTSWRTLPLLVPDRVSQVIEERKRAEKRVEDVESQLAKAIAQDLVVEGKEAVAHTTIFKKHVRRTDDSANVLGFLTTISSALLNEWPSGTTPPLVVLTSSPSLQTASSTTVVVVVSPDEKKVKELGDALKTKLGVKGGGKGVRWSGKFVGPWKETKESVVLGTILEGL